MLEFILQALKVVLPCIAAGAVVRYINVQNEKKQKQIEKMEQGAEATGTPEDEMLKYEIAYPEVIYGIMYVCVVVFTGCLIGSYIDNQLDWFTGTIFGGFCALGVYGVMGTHVWKIWVDEEHITYRDYFGIKHYYTLDDFTRYTERSDGALIVYAGKKRVFKIDNNLPMRAILKYQMNQKRIAKDIDGMTINSFTVKPRAVYWVVSAMCVGFCGWATIGLYKQTGADNILFWSMAVCFVISTVTLLDILLDRFVVEGKQVTRRRGLITKRFSFDEVDYTRVQRGTLRDNIEFYVNGKKITQVWTLNRPEKLLENKLRAEGVKTQSDKKDKNNKNKKGKSSQKKKRK